ncbi:23S rRNA (uracil(1939)-C(5))-methyltransferase RlmD [Liquorilactobacillus mali]|uniref:23S rRNA (uracil(1939)-C(5))-methyltransferase RlmD n=1 Tax=Liquorilactobacillus mali TaxID=1618 RepID=UPI00265508C9|nr:23S rRNA (uracil(1939)-C(5))-methyltransferase RlmD [Liquorilactobacillus mali]MDN7145485.1 23S rRNA (uracil(1939)-C(5))-methyltransferase RlmD [Liquorilactobacillus mali]
MQYKKRNQANEQNLLSLGKRFPLTIKRLGINGEGIGYFKHKVVFVEGALPGEVVVAEVVEDNGRYATAKIHHIRTRSPHRIEKKDEYDVGGIELEHLEYGEQLKFKSDVVSQALEKFKPQGYQKFKLLPTIGMEHPFEYRNKAQFQVRKTFDGKVIAGLYKRGTHELVDLPTFTTQRPLTMKVIRKICKFFEDLEIPIYDERNNSGIIKTIVVRESFATGEVQVVFITNSEKLPKKRLLLEKINNNLPEVTSILQNINKGKTSLIWGESTKLLSGNEYITEKLGNVEFKLSARAFFQLNPYQTQKMYEEVKKALDLGKNEKLVDAYCGVGTIGLFVANDTNEVRGMDITPEAIEDAKLNAELNEQKNFSYTVGKAEDLIPEWQQSGFVFDALVVDPPRTGLDAKLIKTILKAKPRKFVYVSCNPSTLARDLKELTQAYYVEYIQSIDMFPQTARCEAVVKLLRK